MRYQTEIMRRTKVIANFLYFITRVIGAIYFLTFLHAAICLLFKTNSLVYSPEGNRFEINFPFTDIPFLIGDNTQVFIVELLLVLGLYALFLLLASNVFDTFRKEKLFTLQGIFRLRMFYLANLIIPPLIILLFSVISEVEHPLVIMTLIHVTLAVFAYFLAAIFKQGLQLQNEQELFI